MRRPTTGTAPCFGSKYCAVRRYQDRPLLFSLVQWRTVVLTRFGTNTAPSPRGGQKAAPRPCMYMPVRSSKIFSDGVQKIDYLAADS